MSLYVLASIRKLLESRIKTITIELNVTKDQLKRLKSVRRDNQTEHYAHQRVGRLSVSDSQPDDIDQFDKDDENSQFQQRFSEVLAKASRCISEKVNLLSEVDQSLKLLRISDANNTGQMELKRIKEILEKLRKETDQLIDKIAALQSSLKIAIESDKNSFADLQSQPSQLTMPSKESRRRGKEKNTASKKSKWYRKKMERNVLQMEQTLANAQKVQQQIANQQADLKQLESSIHKALAMAANGQRVPTYQQEQQAAKKPAAVAAAVSVGEKDTVQVDSNRESSAVALFSLCRFCLLILVSNFDTCPKT